MRGGASAVDRAGHDGFDHPQGGLAEALAPAALALLTATFPAGRARVRAFGVWSAANATGGALGVVIGGLLTEYAGWRWVMFVSVPMAVGALVPAWRGVTGGAPPARGSRPDMIGAALATAGMTLLVFGIVRTDHYGWTSAMTVTTLTAAAGLLAAFVHVERTTTRETGTASALLNSSRQIGASLGLAALGTAAHRRTGGRTTPEAPADGYGLGLTLSAVLLTAAVVVALTVLPRTGPATEPTH